MLDKIEPWLDEDAGVVAYGIAIALIVIAIVAAILIAG